MGFAIANAFRQAGADVTLVAGPVGNDLKLYSGIRRINVRSALEMLEAMEKEFLCSDIAVCAAAVADYAPAEYADKKIKRAKTDGMTLHLVKNPDISARLGAIKGQRFLAGFALETDNELINALSKMERKNLDMIVLNSLRDEGAGMMTDTNKITIHTREGNTYGYDLKSKREVAEDIVSFIAGHIGGDD